MPGSARPQAQDGYHGIGGPINVPSNSYLPQPASDLPSPHSGPGHDLAPPSAGQHPSDSYGVPPSGQHPSDSYGAPPAGQHPSDSYGAPPIGQQPSDSYGVPPSGGSGSNCCGAPPNNYAPQGDHGPPEQHPGGISYGVPSGKQVEGPHHLQPKVPVKFREPVPSGLIEAQAGKQTFHGQSYIPPAVPELPTGGPSGQYGAPSGGQHGGHQEQHPIPQDVLQGLTQHGSQIDIQPSIQVGLDSSDNYPAAPSGAYGPPGGDPHGSQYAASQDALSFAAPGHFGSGNNYVPRNTDNVLQSGDYDQTNAADAGQSPQPIQYSTIKLDQMSNGVDGNVGFFQQNPFAYNAGNQMYQVQGLGAAAQDQVLSSSLLQDILNAIEHQQLAPSEAAAAGSEAKHKWVDLTNYQSSAATESTPSLSTTVTAQ